MITNVDPINVVYVGISPQIRYPNKIAKTNAKYFKGVTKETSDNLYDWVSHKFPKPPIIPNKDNKNKSFIDGNSHPCGIVTKLTIIIDKEK